MSAREPTGKTPSQLIGEVIAVTLLTYVASRLLLALGRTVPLLTPYIPLLVMAPSLYLPLALMLYRHEPLARYGLSPAHIGRALGLTLLATAIFFPPFAVGFLMFRQGSLPIDAPRFGVSPFAWFNWLFHTPHAWLWLLRSFAWELLFVAVPEEFFYRGYLQGRLNVLFVNRCRILGTSVGLALPVSASLFTLHHFVISPVPPVLLVFFPALLFGWLREASHTLLAPVLFHAACNVFAVLVTKVPPF